MIPPAKQKVIGIDVSKDTLAVSFSVADKLPHLEVSNTKAGFQKLVKSGGSDSLYVMETTGIDYLQLADYLFEQGAQVNPVIIQRFIQMHLGKGKSGMLNGSGAMESRTKLFTGNPSSNSSRQLEQVTEPLIKQRTMVLNSLEALERQPLVSELALKSLKQTLKMLDKQVKQIQEKLLATLEKPFAKEIKLLSSIPGIGRKTAGMLLLFAGSFQKTDNDRPLIAKAGLSPREYNSGPSIRGKTRITKMGGSLIQSKLYVGSFSAKKSQAAGQALYERLVAKGKNGKLALIAVCNKLLKQAFAIVQAGIPYQPVYSQNLAYNA